MTDLLKLLLEHTTLRRSYADLIEKDETEENTAELRSIDDKLKEIEKRMADLQEEQAKEPEPAKDFKLSKPVSECEIGDIYAAAIAHAETRGAVSELQKELGLRSNQIPLAMIERVPDPKEIETRAVTPGVSSPTTAAEILPILFPQSATEFLGVTQVTVPSGQAGYPALTAGATASVPAKDASVAESTGAFTLTTLTPKRIQASFFYSREDANAFAGMGEALRANLESALADQLDIQVLANLVANGTDNDQSSAQVTLALLETAFNGSVDGLFANGFGDLFSAISPELFARIAGLRIANTELSGYDILRQGSVRVTKNLPAISSKKQKQIIRRGVAPAAVTPIWEGITLIPDEITKAATGQIVITAVMLYNTAVLRSGAFITPEFQVTA